MTKTCGECKHLNRELAFCRACGAKWIKETDGASCKYFEKKTPPTNGDKIIAGGMRAIAEFQQHLSCTNCVYFSVKMAGQEFCHKPDDKTCTDGIEAWLNAPAESEGEDDTGRN